MVKRYKIVGSCIWLYSGLIFAGFPDFSKFENWADQVSIEVEVELEKLNEINAQLSQATEQSDASKVQQLQALLEAKEQGLIDQINTVTAEVDQKSTDASKEYVSISDNAAGAIELELSSTQMELTKYEKLAAQAAVDGDAELTLAYDQAVVAWRRLEAEYNDLLVKSYEQMVASLTQSVISPPRYLHSKFTLIIRLLNHN